MVTVGTTRASTLTQNLVLFILPLAILGGLALALFIDFLGAQAAELAKLINEIEIQCKADFLGSIGLRAATDAAASGNVTCAQYLPKVLLFFVLLALWCIVSNVMTLKLFESLKSYSLRLVIAAIVTFSLPAILLFKYWSVIPFNIGVAGGFPAFTVLIIIATIVFQALFANLLFRHEKFLQKVSSISFLLISSVVVFVGLSLLFAYSPVNLFNEVGSVNTIVLYVTLTYAFLGGLFYYSTATGFPIAALLLLWILGIDFIGINHATTVPARDLPAQPIKGDQQFLTWLDKRRDKDAFANQDYPVYIVASAGGGIYAAMRTAYFLDFLQKRCPAFAHHLFAISGVSGGALGALTFASQQQSLEPRPLGPCDASDDSDALANPEPTPILDNFFSKDLLSTIVGAGLFPNMLQRILPFPVPSFDRSEAFRKALGDNWRQALRATSRRTPHLMRRGERRQGDCSTRNFFVKCEINAYWDAAGDVPVLIFNTTEVDTGSPVVLSNLDAKYYANSLAARNSPSFENKSIYLVDSASLSARFPIALPAGFLRGFDGPNSIRLVDGGYFDGSGLTIAQAVKLALQDIAAAQNRKVKVRIIFLGEKVPSIYDAIAQAAEPGTSMTMGRDETPRSSEIAAHAKALLQAMDQRATETLRQVFKQDPTLLRFQWDPFLTGQADTPCSSIPLAWYLAPCTLKVLKDRLQIAVLDSTDSYDVLRTELAPSH
jgi:hypothetical protein